ncbi:GTPase IMAP family member 7-like [Morone saxatilis]|uniref:GTPase IMAP family member 7-like n=1 Tax=Morone saxatilis TaxID=34816 RepID=UPI0015E25340|nr:GTPase IMAP family member 7-like [Morone saxatilis]
MWIDTPGFFDTERSEEELKPEIVRCITECTPGPHVILIVLKVEKFTEQEQDIIKQMHQYFSEEALKYAIVLFTHVEKFHEGREHEQAVINKIHEYFSEEVFRYTVVLFTHGDQLEEGKKIEELVHQHKFLSDLVEKCGSRCHVIDNKYWNKNPNDEYRSNQFQVEELLKSIDKMTEANKGSCYTNEMLQKVENEIQQEGKRIRLSSVNMSDRAIREKARDSIFTEILNQMAGFATTALLRALFGAGKVTQAVASPVTWSLGALLSYIGGFFQTKRAQ